MADYSTDVGGDLRAGVNLLATFTGKTDADFGPFRPVFDSSGNVVPSTLANPQFLPIDSYWLVNLSLRLESTRWTVRLFADNLFNERFESSRDYMVSYSQYQRSDVAYYPNRPRTVGVAFTKSF